MTDINNADEKIMNSRFFRGFAFLLGFAISTSTALQNMTVLLVPLFVICIPSLRRQLRKIISTPIVLAGALFFLILILGCTWSIAPLTDQIRTLVGMRWLLLFPFLLVFFSIPHLGLSSLLGFASSVFLSAILSIVFAMMHIEAGMATLHDWAVFRTHTFHNYFIALLVYGLLVLRTSAQWHARWHRFFLVAIAVLIFDSLALVQGRSGNIVLLALLGLYLFQRLHWRGLMIGIGILALTIPLLINIPTIRHSIDRANTDIAEYMHGKTDTSIGLRLEFYQNSLQLIRLHPLLGTGTGSFTQSYRELTGHIKGNRATSNPHNDYLKLMVELGILGFTALIALLISALQQTKGIARYRFYWVQGLILSMALASLANSFFTDNVTSAAFVVLLSLLLARCPLINSLEKT